MCIRPGISFSARSSSLRPKSARLMSANGKENYANVVRTLYLIRLHWTEWPWKSYAPTSLIETHRENNSFRNRDLKLVSFNIRDMFELRLYRVEAVTAVCSVCYDIWRLSHLATQLIGQPLVSTFLATVISLVSRLSEQLQPVRHWSCHFSV